MESLNFDPGIRPHVTEAVAPGPTRNGLTGTAKSRLMEILYEPIHSDSQCMCSRASMKTGRVRPEKTGNRLRIRQAI